MTLKENFRRLKYYSIENNMVICYVSDPLHLNSNNNSNVNGTYNDAAVGASGLTLSNRASKSDETIRQKNSRHSYRQKRRSRARKKRNGQSHDAKTDNSMAEADFKKDHPPSALRRYGLDVSNQSNHGNRAFPFPDAPQKPKTPSSICFTIPSPLQHLLQTLSNYASPSQVPLELKDSLFSAVFLPYLDQQRSGSVRTASVASVASVEHILVTPSTGSQKIIVSLRAHAQQPLDADCSSQICFHDVFGPKRTNVTPNDEYASSSHSNIINPFRRSPSIVCLDEDSAPYSPILCLGQESSQFHYNSDLASIQRAVFAEDDDDELSDHDNARATQQEEAFSFDYVHRMVFGYSLPPINGYRQTLPPMLPPSIIQRKVAADGINDVVIGKGCFGKVLKATLSVFPGENQDVVVKQPFMNMCNERDIAKEAKIAIYLESTGFVPICYGLLRDEMGLLTIVSELFGNGDTVHHLLNERKLSQEDWLDIACQLAIGLSKVHEKNVLINDIKSDNILVNLKQSVPHVKFCDMGSASHRSGVCFEDDNMDVYVHLAPEVRAYGPTTKESDVYSLGRILKKICQVSKLKSLSRLYKECMANNPNDRMPLSLLRSRLTNVYQSELMSSSNGGKKWQDMDFDDSVSSDIFSSDYDSASSFAYSEDRSPPLSQTTKEDCLPPQTFQVEDFQDRNKKTEGACALPETSPQVPKFNYADIECSPESEVLQTKVKDFKRDGIETTTQNEIPKESTEQVQSQVCSEVTRREKVSSNVPLEKKTTLANNDVFANMIETGKRNISLTKGISEGIEFVKRSTLKLEEDEDGLFPHQKDYKHKMPSCDKTIIKSFMDELSKVSRSVTNGKDNGDQCSITASGSTTEKVVINTEHVVSKETSTSMDQANKTDTSDEPCPAFSYSKKKRRGRNDRSRSHRGLPDSRAKSKLDMHMESNPMTAGSQSEARLQTLARPMSTSWPQSEFLSVPCLMKFIKNVACRIMGSLAALVLSDDDVYPGQNTFEFFLYLMLILFIPAFLFYGILGFI